MMGLGFAVSVSRCHPAPPRLLPPPHDRPPSPATSPLPLSPTCTPGAPAISVPAGFVRKASPQPFGGATSLQPVGLQLLSRPFDEKTLFKLA